MTNIVSALKGKELRIMSPVDIIVVAGILGLFVYGRITRKQRV